jgi:hypothetical protein
MRISVSLQTKLSTKRPNAVHDSDYTCWKLQNVMTWRKGGWVDGCLQERFFWQNDLCGVCVRWRMVEGWLLKIERVIFVSISPAYEHPFRLCSYIATALQLSLPSFQDAMYLCSTYERHVIMIQSSYRHSPKLRANLAVSSSGRRFTIV